MDAKVKLRLHRTSDGRLEEAMIIQVSGVAAFNEAALRTAERIVERRGAGVSA